MNPTFDSRRAILGAPALLAMLTAGFDALAAPPPLAVSWNDTASGAGGARLIDTTAPWPFLSDPVAIGANATLRYAAGVVYAVSPTQSTVTAIDADTWTLLAVHAIPGASDPLDIAVAGPGLAYVTRRFSTQLLRLDLASGATQEVLDLSGFERADGFVEIGMLDLYQGRLFVQVAVYDSGGGGTALPESYLAVVDVASEQLVDTDPVAPRTQAIRLVGTPPKHKMQIVADAARLFVSASGAFFDEGGIERVDLDALQSLGLVVAEADGNVAADLGSFVLVRPERGYLVFSTDLLPSSHLHDFTLTGGASPTPEYHTAVDYRVPTMVHEVITDTFFLPEGGFGGDGVHVFDAADGRRLTDGTSLVGGILPTPGTPTDVVLLCDDLAACGPSGAPGGCAPVPAVSRAGQLLIALLTCGAGALALERTARRRRSSQRLSRATVPTG